MCSPLTAGLHIKPLTPLLARVPLPDAAFMEAYTRPAFFASELLLFHLINSHVPEARWAYACVTSSLRY